MVKSEQDAKKACTQVKCPVANCGANVGKASAVLHMSFHQLNGDNDTSICGFCGKAGHDPPVQNKTGKKWSFPAACGFAGHNLTLKSLKIISSASPFSNYPMKCEQCSEVIWRFDFENHFRIAHKDEICPPVGVVSKSEKQILKLKSQKGKPKMLKKDFDRLSDAELKLFSYKDFWNSSKHTWASGDAGRFGKQNSAKMKELFGEENFV